MDGSAACMWASYAMRARGSRSDMQRAGVAATQPLFALPVVTRFLCFFICDRPGSDERFHRAALEPDRVGDPHVRQVAALAELVDGGRGDTRGTRISDPGSLAPLHPPWRRPD